MTPSPYITAGLERNSIINIIRVTCQAFNVQETKLSKPSRKREIVEARQMIYTLFCTVANMALQPAANIFSQDHATALHGIRTTQVLYTVDKDFNQRAQKAIAGLNASECIKRRLQKFLIHEQSIKQWRDDQTLINKQLTEGVN